MFNINPITFTTNNGCQLSLIIKKEIGSDNLVCVSVNHTHHDIEFWTYSTRYTIDLLMQCEFWKPIYFCHYIAIKSYFIIYDCTSIEWTQFYLHELLIVTRLYYSTYEYVKYYIRYKWDSTCFEKNLTVCSNVCKRLSMVFIL